MSEESAAPSDEVWLPIPGYDNWYDISDRGRVRSWRGHGKRAIHPNVLTPVPNKRGGYLQVIVCHPDGKVRCAYVHLLVLTAFVGERPQGMVARHLDGDVLNCRPSNLSWGTQVENFADQCRHGTDTRGVRNGMSVLRSMDQVREIRARLTNGERGCDVAELFGISQASVSRIRHGLRFVEH